MSACEAITAADCRQRHIRQQRPRRHHHEEGLRRLRVDEQQRALAEVVQQQRRQHHAEPGDTNRTLAEVPHVRVQRLAAGDDEEDRAEHGEAVPAVLAEERHAVTGIERLEHLRRAEDPRHADERDGHEPHRHHRTEQSPTRSVPCC